MHGRFPTLLRGELPPTEPDDSGKSFRCAQTAETMDAGSTQSSDECCASISRCRTVPGLSPAELGAEYPVDLKVRNTFLHFPNVNRPESWDDCLELRQVRSAPGSRQFDENLTKKDESNVAEVPTERQQVRAVLDLSSMLSRQLEVSPPAAAASATSAGGYRQPRSQPLSNHGSREARLGSAEVPTVGSAGHGSGHCKPCAFVWKGDGCSNSVDCPFCHLCDPGEKKKRAKEKKMHIRTQRSGGGGGQGFGHGRLSQTFRNIFS